MTDTEKTWLLARLDWFYDLSTCIIRYFRQHDNMSFDIARETYMIAKLQLKHFMKDHYEDIFKDEALYNYYECVVREFEFIDNNLTILV